MTSSLSLLPTTDHFHSRSL
uniref:Uncharacterized protein n=1 Tax=Rhizophora mucronata TaxID=61149 RepID=A0A2P2R3V9_RHIMU